MKQGCFSYSSSLLQPLFETSLKKIYNIRCVSFTCEHPSKTHHKLWGQMFIAELFVQLYKTKSHSYLRTHGRGTVKCETVVSQTIQSV